ncbi:hypothetical protein BLOT_015668 [Blomia tropicalis]|nr:hypothetical protein BLOT_015668 [Blomia tropicalis]
MIFHLYHFFVGRHVDDTKRWTIKYQTMDYQIQNDGRYQTMDDQIPNDGLSNTKRWTIPNDRRSNTKRWTKRHQTMDDQETNDGPNGTKLGCRSLGTTLWNINLAADHWDDTLEHLD